MGTLVPVLFYGIYDMKIAVCLHLFYTDMLDEVFNYLLNLKHDYKLYVNIPVENYNQNIEQRIKTFKSDSVCIKSPNKGVDIGGFLNTLLYVDKDTDLILKIHTKKGIGSESIPSHKVRRIGFDETIKHGKKWFNGLMTGVLGDENKVTKIIDTFKTDQKLGMVGFKKYNIYGINGVYINELVKLLNINKKHIGGDFIGGTMFWVKYDIIKKYFNDDMIKHVIRLLPNGYTLEPSVNHAMERIFGYMVSNENKEIRVM